MRRDADRTRRPWRWARSGRRLRGQSERDIALVLAVRDDVDGDDGAAFPGAVDLPGAAAIFVDATKVRCSAAIVKARRLAVPNVDVDLHRLEGQPRGDGDLSVTSVATSKNAAMSACGPIRAWLAIIRLDPFPPVPPGPYHIKAQNAPRVPTQTIPRSIVVAGLEEVDAVVADEMDHAVLLGQTARPDA